MTSILLGERFYGERKPAWMNFCKTFKEPTTALEALQAAGLDYTVSKQPLSFSWPAPLGLTSLEPYEGKFAMVRDPIPNDPMPRTLGIVGKDFTPIQNRDIAKTLDLITDTWPVHACGGFRDGAGTFFALDAGECSIKGDIIHQYLTLSDFKGGGRAYRIYLTPTRMFCQNQLVSSFKQASVAVTLAHYAGADADMMLRIELIGKLQKAQATLLDTFTRMATRALSAKGFNTMVEAAYPYPPRPRRAALNDDIPDSLEVEQFGKLITQATTAQEKWEWVKSRQDAFRKEATTLYEIFNDKNPTLANTPWAGWNSIVELADFREGSGDIAYSTLFGPRANEKIRAFEVAVKI
jgi:hypothetical protein